jgi:hypothetical protein
MMRIDNIEVMKHEPFHRVGNRIVRNLHNNKTIIYVNPKGENLIQNLKNRRSRPYNLYRKFIPVVMRMAFGSWFNDVKANWSQKAGCSCGCSPGFIVTGHQGYDVWVTMVEE